MINKPILCEIQNLPRKHIPIWLMRQAGRYMPEFREIRHREENFLKLCYNPILASEITLQPIKKFGFDGAILFSDILTIPDSLGHSVNFVRDKGPVLDKIVNSNDIKKLNINNIKEKLSPVYEAIGMVKTKLPPETTLIGFAGSPWTIAAYMVEGGGSKDFPNAKKMAYGDEKLFSELIEILVNSVSFHVIEQIKAGAELIQLFDSWSGVLPEEQFWKWVIYPTKRIIENVKSSFPDIPIIGFPKGAGHMYADYVINTKVDVIGIDSVADAKAVRAKCEDKVVIQGHLDPVFLLTTKELIKTEAEKILNNLSDSRFIFNLGHGVLPETPMENVKYLVEVVKNYKAL